MELNNRLIEKIESIYFNQLCAMRSPESNLT